MYNPLSNKKIMNEIKTYLESPETHDRATENKLVKKLVVHEAIKLTIGLIVIGVITLVIKNIDVTNK